MLLIEDKEIDIFVASKIGSLKHIKYHTDTTKNNKKYIENLVDIKTLQKDEGITRMEWSNAEQTEMLIGRKNQQIQIYNTLQGFTKSYTADFAPGEVVGLGRCKRKLLAAVSSGVVKIWSGEENDLKIWRIGEPAPTFVAKNLPHDWLQLRRPVWVTDLVFLPQEGGRLVGVCSRHGYVRQVLVGFGRGQLHQVDLRKGKPDKGYKGCVGAVTDISIVKEPRLIVSSSLDRQLRVHDYASKDLVYKQYLTSKLSCVLIQSESSTPLSRVEEVKEEKPELGVEEIEADDLDTLEKPKKTKLKPEPEELPAKKIRPSSEGATDADLDNTDDAIKKLLRSTEKQKRKREQKKREKKAKSVFHNA
ncbi:hypothetical protein SFRURICE_011089 [Spodoptera frugiperda]|nr:hypothetical protein SFRURICE_011089 [Spodoptera frugiperda]